MTAIGLPHTFRNGGAGTLRFLLTISPASHLGYFEEQADVLQAAQGMPDPQAMMVVMQRWGLEPVRPASYMSRHDCGMQPAVCGRGR